MPVIRQDKPLDPTRRVIALNKQGSCRSNDLTGSNDLFAGVAKNHRTPCNSDDRRVDNYNGTKVEREQGAMPLEL